MQNLSKETIVYSNPTILEWKEIITQLNHMLIVPTLSGYEKIMIEDFLSFIDEKFAYLNPYDSFHKCKGNSELLERRISNLLESISVDKNKVNYHKGWGYYIQTPYQQIQQIGLIDKRNESGWSLELSFYFGDSQRQAESFYSSNPNITHLNKGEWSCFPNFHVSIRASNLVWFQSEDNENYLHYWKKNIGQIKQQKRDNIPNYLQCLVNERVINITKEKEEELNKKFYNKQMKTLNMCPGFGMIYTLKSNEAEELDKSGKLESILVEKIREGLKVVGLDGKEILKKF